MDRSLILLGIKKNLGWSQFFLRVDKSEILNNYYIYIYIYIFFLRLGWSCDHTSLNVPPPLDLGGEEGVRAVLILLN